MTNETQTLAALKRLLKAAQSEPTGPEGFSDNMIAAMQNANEVVKIEINSNLVEAYLDLQDAYADISVHMSTGTSKQVTDFMTVNEQAKFGRKMSDIVSKHYDTLTKLKDDQPQ